MAGEQGDAAVAVTGQVLGDDTAARGVVHEDPVDLAAVHIAVEQHERHPGLEEVIGPPWTARSPPQRRRRRRCRRAAPPDHWAPRRRSRRRGSAGPCGTRPSGTPHAGW